MVYFTLENGRQHGEAERPDTTPRRNYYKLLFVVFLNPKAIANVFIAFFRLLFFFILCFFSFSLFLSYILSLTLFLPTLFVALRTIQQFDCNQS